MPPKKGKKNKKVPSPVVTITTGSPLDLSAPVGGPGGLPVAGTATTTTAPTTGPGPTPILPSPPATSTAGPHLTLTAGPPPFPTTGSPLTLTAGPLPTSTAGPPLTTTAGPLPTFTAGPIPTSTVFTMAPTGPGITSTAPVGPVSTPALASAAPTVNPFDQIVSLLNGLPAATIQKWIDEQLRRRDTLSLPEQRDLNCAINKALNLLEEAQEEEETRRLHERLMAITCTSTAPPVTSTTVLPVPSTTCCSGSTTAVHTTRLKDVLDRQGDAEPLSSFHARCSKAIRYLGSIPFDVLCNQLHMLVNKRTAEALSTLLASGRAPTNIDSLFHQLNLRLPETSAEADLKQTAKEAVATFADRIYRHISQQVPDLSGPAREYMAAEAFLAGLRDRSIRTDILKEEERWKIAMRQNRAPLNILLDWAIASERAAARADAANDLVKIRAFHGEPLQQQQLPKFSRNDASFNRTNRPAPSASQPTTDRQQPRQPPIQPAQSQSVQQQADNSQNDAQRQQRNRRRLAWPESIDRFPHYKEAGVCWRCGTAGHRFYDRDCPQFPPHLQDF